MIHKFEKSVEGLGSTCDDLSYERLFVPVGTRVKRPWNGLKSWNKSMEE